MKPKKATGVIGGIYHDFLFMHRALCSLLIDVFTTL